MVHRRFSPSIKLAVTHLYIWVETGAVSLSKNQTVLEPGLLDPKTMH